MLLLVPGLLSADEVRPVSGGAVLVEPGASLAGVRIGESAVHVMARLGQPVGEEVAGTVKLAFWRYGITVYARGGSVVAVSATNSLLRTREGLGLGSGLEQVTGVFGTSFTDVLVEGFRGIAYPDRGIAFGLDGGAVAVVHVFGSFRDALGAGLEPVPASGTQAADGYPDVSSLRPFTPETMGLSLPGYLRYLVHRERGVWLDYREAVRIVKRQLRAKKGR
jgi:hypothetical protein